MSLFFGVRGAAQLVEAAPGVETDLGAPMALRVRTNRLAPAGLFAEAVLSRVVLAVAYQGAPTLTLRVFADDVLRCERTVVLPAQAQGASRSVRIGTSRPVAAPGGTAGRLAVRGTWLQLEVETTPGVALDGAELVWMEARRR